MEAKEDKGLAISDEARQLLTKWLSEVMGRAGLLDSGRFLGKRKFREKGFLGSGGLARFRDMLWAAAMSTTDVSNLSAEELETLAEKHKKRVKIRGGKA